MNSKIGPRSSILTHALHSPKGPCVRLLSSTAHIPRKVHSPPPTRHSTPLAKYLSKAITATGPIPLASYMRQCLTSDLGGYYTGSQSSTHDQFGLRGDFVTSPEVSQIFGELIGIWFLTEWLAQGQVKRVRIIEFGPGRGTLMDDLLRTLQYFKHMARCVETVYLIEASPSLREVQRKLLCVKGAPFVPVENGYSCTSKYSPTPITWYEDFSFIPKDPELAPFVVAHEFFDALPIHAFTHTDVGWRELLVTTAKHKGEFTTSRDGVSRLQTDANAPEFGLTLAASPTPHSVLLPGLSQRYKSLESLGGATIEVSPESLSLMEKISQAIGSAGAGAALVIDYGTDTVPANSLRGVSRHRVCSPFSRPGEVDVSADVDFMALAEQAIGASDTVEAHGPVMQGAFLGMLGAKERADIIKSSIQRMGKDSSSKSYKTTCSNRVAAIDKSYDRLVKASSGCMGGIYKALAVVPEREGRRPVGFGGDLPWSNTPAKRVRKKDRKPEVAT